MAKMRYKPLRFDRSTHTEPDAELLSHLLKPFCDSNRQCAWQDAALALSALVSLDCCDGEKAFDRLVAVLEDGLTQADDFECLSLALWSLVASRTDDVLVDEVTRRTAVVLESTLEGLADKDELRPRTAKALLRACRRVRTAGLLVGHRRGCGDVEGVWSRLIEGTHGVWKKLEQWVDESQVSRLQQQVAAALRAAGGKCGVEWDDGKASVDIVLYPRSTSSCPPSLLPIALEVDGPRHFFVNRRRDPTGDTLVKRRALQEGYRDTWQAVISLAHFEWGEEQKDRDKLFRRKLCESGVDPLMYLDAG